jgi:hypothetical protein
MADFDSASLDSIYDLKSGHDFAGGECLNLEFSIRGLAHGLGEYVRAAIDRFERFRPTGWHPPLQLRHRLRDGGCYIAAAPIPRPVAFRNSVVSWRSLSLIFLQNSLIAQF